jgi:hypothetical protein
MEFIASVPIFADDANPEAHQQRIIGVLNFETATKDANYILGDEGIWKGLSAQLTGTANVLNKYL